ncbi:MAG: response regulator [Verrucomicrobiaceae bacterium]|nr:response regulator [Verrucomicrobiaceae bacterium]
MSLVETTEPPTSLAPEASVGVLVIEARSTTPLGPRIVYANERIARLSGYEMSSLIGSPLGLLYERSDLSALIEKLPVIAARPNHCYMDRMLMRNGGTRRPCRWTIRSTTRERDGRGFFTLTIKPVVVSLRGTPALRGAAPGKTASRPTAKSARHPSVSPATSAERAANPASTTRTPPAAESPAAPATQTAVTAPPLDPSTATDYAVSRTEAISLTAAGVAHDFKNALQTIKSNLELAAVHNPGGGKLGVFLNEAHLALGDAEILAHQMLAFTRGEGNNKRVFGLGDLLVRVSRLCSAGSGIRCKLFVPSHLRRVEGDPTRIYQVLHNLVINASQAMPSGGTIHLIAGNADLTDGNPYSMPSGRYTVASVKDRGCGIPPEILPHIFSPNFTTKPEGSGFGLASCQAIVEHHGGAIRVASKVGVGTEFLVFLPSTDAAADPAGTFSPNLATSRPAAPSAPSPESEASLVTPDSGCGRVLVVEDQADVARAACGLLKHLGYENLHSANGEEAIARYREHLDSDEAIDVVLLDMTLPGGLSGMEVAKEIHRIDPLARIIATSGYFEEGDLAKGLNGNFAAILPKPYSMRSLSEAMDAAMTH